MYSITIGGRTISVTADGRTDDNRPRYRYTVGDHTANDLAGPVGGRHVLTAGMESLVGFLSACAESIGYTSRTGREGDNAELFPRKLHDWIAANADEFALLECEMQEAGE